MMIILKREKRIRGEYGVSNPQKWSLVLLSQLPCIFLQYDFGTFLKTHALSLPNYYWQVHTAAQTQPLPI